MVDLSNALSLAFSVKKTKSDITWVVNTGLLAVILAVGFGYLFTINSLGTEGYRIRQLETQYKQLESKHKTLELEASNLQSISNIQVQAQEMNYVPAGTITYIKEADFALK